MDQRINGGRSLLAVNASAELQAVPAHQPQLRQYLRL